MRKRDELSNPNSCLNKARDGEIVFVLRGDDDSFAAGVRGWIEDRIAKGKNRREDAKIVDAEEQIANVEAERQLAVGDEPANLADAVDLGDVLRDAAERG